MLVIQEGQNINQIFIEEKVMKAGGICWKVRCLASEDEYGQAFAFVELMV